MKHGDFHKARTDYHANKAAFEEIAKRETRHYVLRVTENELVEIVVDPEKVVAGTPIRIFQKTFTQHGPAGITDITDRGMHQFSADELAEIAATHKMVERWVAGTLEALSPSTAEEAGKKIYEALKAKAAAEVEALKAAAEAEAAERAKTAAKVSEKSVS